MKLARTKYFLRSIELWYKIVLLFMLASYRCFHEEPVCFGISFKLIHVEFQWFCFEEAHLLLPWLLCLIML